MMKNELRMKLAKPGKFILIYCTILFLIAFVVGMVGFMTYEYTFSYSGFAVDSQGVLYIGVDNGKIQKYVDGRLIDTISAQTSRGYEFTITKKDKVYIDCGDRAYLTDLDGNVLDEIKGNVPSFSKFRKDKNEFIASDGTRYQQKYNFGRTKIIKHQGESTVTVFEMPLENYFFKIVLVYGWVIVVSFIMIIIIKSKKEQGVW